MRLVQGAVGYLLLVTLLLLTACNPLKKIPEGDALYTGSKVIIDSTTLSKKKEKALRSELASLIRPKPNKKFLGIRFKLTMYYMAGNPKNEKSIAGWLKNKVGEPPVLLSDFNLERNADVIQNRLENTGYFNARTTGDTTIRGKLASATFRVETGNRYRINDIRFDTLQDALHTAINRDTGSSLLKRGDYYELDVIKNERNRIDAGLKEKGFYYFDPDFLIVQVDSSVGNSLVNMRVRVKPNVPKPALQPYRMNQVFIFPNFRTNSTVADTSFRGMVNFEGLNIIDRRNTYRPRLFTETMQLDSGELYNRKDQNATLSRLINLGMFRFVKNVLEPVKDADSAKLDAFYFLTPMQRQSLRGEVNASTKSNNLTGSSITLSWRKRNAFRGGELLNIEATGGFEVQFSGNLKGYNTYRAGISASVTFPRRIVPFIRWSNEGDYVPKTITSVAYDLLTKQRLYQMNSFSVNYGYSWKTSALVEHKLNPIAINYVQPAYVTQEYIDSIVANPYLLKAINIQFILGSNYNFNYSEIVGSIYKTGIYFNGNIDLSGNLAGLVTKKDQTGHTIGGRYFSQYIRGEADFRYYLRLSKYKVLANRVILGGSVPYGNSNSLPFVKQFFSGGNNSLRGFRSRSVGPGTYRQPESTGFLPDQSGDIKVEFNTELRGRLFSIVHGAVFLDAGNIWLYRDDTLFFPGSDVKFGKNFMKELAVDAGVGIRFDITFLVLRFDVGMPLRKPYLPEGQRWVIDQIDFGSKSWRRENLIFNLGIGYPF